ncbi:MAG: tRNA lysidine(34) synthetase TilS [Candidatus Accumulibacter sp.]|nr:tRNA lysidine(34) synthetase TilS [Accumulibacter sp.]
MAVSRSRRCPELPAVAAGPQIQQTLASFLGPRLALGRRLCVALSGGRDSVVLLHALAGLRRLGLAGELSALHVNHSLSSDADAWAAFCSDLCQRLQVPLTTTRVVVPPASGEGLEAAARRQRHAVFGECPADWLALAHHRDDQAETVLFRLLRGAGVDGAAGMRAERPQPAGARLIRPLLDLPRSALAAYAAEHALVWIEDTSNHDCRYRRNHLRQEVLPRIAEQFPGADQVLARAARHFAEAALLLDELATIDRANVATEQGRIDLLRFNALSAGRARNLLRRELLAAGFRAPEARWLDEAMRQMTSAGAGAETCVETPDGALHVYRGEVHLVGRRPAIPQSSVVWRGEEELSWGGGRVLLPASVGAGISRHLLSRAPVCLQARLGGEQLQPDPRRPRRALRKLLQEAAIPPWERARLPLLWCGAQLVWVGGIGADAAFACGPGEDGITPVWERVERRPAGGASRRTG